MITINLCDKKIRENLEALQELRDSGLFFDEELQELYNNQVAIDEKGGVQE